MGGWRAHLPGQAPARAGGRSRCRAASPGSQAACLAKASGSGTTGMPAGPRRPCPKLCPGSFPSFPSVPGTLKVPFPIPRRARPQAAISATFRDAM